MERIARQILKRRELWSRTGGDFAKGMTAAYNAVLRDILGLTEEDINQLKSQR